MKNSSYIDNLLKYNKTKKRKAILKAGMNFKWIWQGDEDSLFKVDGEYYFNKQEFTDSLKIYSIVDRICSKQEFEDLHQEVIDFPENFI